MLTGELVIDYLLIALGFLAFVFFIYWLWRRLDENRQAQRLLDRYLSGSLSAVEIGIFYERYIGYLYEGEGFRVDYHGAIKGASDMGIDLIVRSHRETLLVQTKCWAKHKLINENHIFQLYGSMEHFKLVSDPRGKVRAVFCTTAQYSQTARDVAKVLGVELKLQRLDKSYPLIKCNNSVTGEKIYHLPFDPFYDKIKINAEKGDFYAHFVKDAVAGGFRRARNRSRQSNR